jgi:hypothetical protein
MVKQIGALENAKMTRSGNLDFFAAEADMRNILDFLFSSTDVRVFESYSEFGKELREFHSTDELAAFPLGTDQYGNGTAIMLKLWSPSVMRDLTITRIDLNPRFCNGHTFRYSMEGGGLMHLYLGGVCERDVTKSNFGHFSQAAARTWNLEEGVNWDALKTLSNRIQYHIRKRLAVDKAWGMPVLPQARELALAGYALKLAVQTPFAFELDSAN